MSGQGCASASIPRELGWEREKQRRHWVDSWDTKRSTSAAPNLSQIWFTGSASIPLNWSSVLTRSTPLGSRPLGYEPLSGTKSWPVPKEEAGAHACSGCMTGSLPGDWCETPPPCCPSWRWHVSGSGTEESEWELDELLSTPGHLGARWGTCLTRHRKPVVPRKPLPIPRGKHPSLSFGDSRLPPYVLHSGENWGSATLKGQGKGRLTLLVGEGMAKSDEYPGTSSTRGMVSYGAVPREEPGKLLPWGLGACDTGPLTRADLAWSGPCTTECSLPEQGPDASRLSPGRLPRKGSAGLGWARSSGH